MSSNDSECVCVCVWPSYRRAVLHHRVVELVALGRAPREEAALTHIIVKVLQTAIPTETENEGGRGGGGGGGEGEREGEGGREGEGDREKERKKEHKRAPRHFVV